MMRRFLSMLASLAVLGCAGAPAPPGATVDGARLLAAAVPGVATRASLEASFGPATRQRFDSGMEAWLYLAPAGAGRYTELVILFDRDGIVRKVRSRPPHAFDEAEGR